MKIIKILIVVLLSVLSIYLLFKLFTKSEFGRIDSILLIILLLGGMINSFILLFHKKNEK
jgi:hypothetical protein